MIALSLLFSILFTHPYSVVINKENVFNIVGGNDHVFVHFFADGCPHCAKVAPEWNEIVRMYHPIDGVKFATINCDRFNGLCTAFDGTSTPEIEYFAPKQRRGEHYGGEKEVLPLARWIKTMASIEPYSAPGNLMFSNEKEIDNISQSKPVLLVIDSPRKTFFNHTEIRLCEGQRQIEMRAINHTQQISHKFCHGASNCLVLINGKRVIQFENEVKAENIISFIDSNTPSGDI